MDLRAEVDYAAQELERGELASTLQAAISAILVDMSNPPPPPPVPAELQLIIHPQSAVGAHGGDIPMGADPCMMVAINQGQYWHCPVVTLPEGVKQILHPVAVLNGDVLYEIPAEVSAPAVSAAPPVKATKSKKKKEEDDGQAYVKKPPNAFMLYMKEQRPYVDADVKSRGSLAVNVVLGQRWNSLTQEEQAKYYIQAEVERLLHAQRYPNWSFGDNYGKKRKWARVRKAPTKAKAVMEPQPLDTDGLVETLEFLPPTTSQPQLPSTACADLTVDVNQIRI